MTRKRTKRPTAIRLARLPDISARYLRGETQQEIADAHELNQSTIARDLEYLRELWRDSALLSFSDAQARELARIDNLEREAWGEYQRSKQARERSGRRVTQRGDDSRIVTASTDTESRLGDPKYLSIVQWCIEQRCKILGIYAQATAQVAGDIAVRFVYASEAPAPAYSDDDDE